MLGAFDRDNWYEIWAVLRSNKLRTALTAFGVAWGIFMLIVMLGFGSAMQAGTQRNLKGRATNLLFVWGQTTTEGYNGMKPGRQIVFRTADIDRLRRLPAIEWLAPRLQLGGWQSNYVVAYGTKTGTYNVWGDYPDYRHIVSFEYAAGRFISEGDIADNRKVAVVGDKVVEELFPAGANPIGDHIKISGVYFEVVGMIKTLRTGRDGDRDAHSIFVPFTTLKTAFNQGDNVAFFAMTARPGTDGPELERQVREALSSAHSIAPTDHLAIGSFNAFVFFGKIQDVMFWLWAISWIVGGMTLLAGVIGVSNIMLIAVKERTKEFGVRKALGATPRSVITMVLMENIVLTLLAGLIGIGFACGVLYQFDGLLTNVAPDSPLAAFGAPQVGLGTVLQALAVLVGSATLAGLIPATHAASIKPIEALRAE
ncbi:MAG TPA: ABC transporter permease [Kofleriaceae bacterium]|jgi:putative ABC transport system permease protein|nr:ABC transporter permease [Kofleriaceae bacterium]